MLTFSKVSNTKISMYKKWEERRASSALNKVLTQHSMGSLLFDILTHFFELSHCRDPITCLFRFILFVSFSILYHTSWRISKPFSYTIFLSLFIYLYILFSSFISTKQKTQIDFHNFDQFEQLEKSVLFCVVSFFITFFVTMLCVKHVVRVIRCRITIYNIFCLLSKWMKPSH